MSTSTPSSGMKNAKLYDYLKGFETACFTGSNKSEVVKSFTELFQCEQSMLLKQASSASMSKLVSQLNRLADSFLTKYYGRMASLSNPSKVADLADKSKKDYKSLASLLSTILIGSTDPMVSMAVCPISGDRLSSSLVDICDKCPYYLSHKFCLLYDTVGEEDVQFNIVNFYISEYKYLALCLLRLTNFLLTEEGVNLNNLSRYHMLYEYILTLGKIFELMNPSGEIRQGYLDEAEILLTQPPLDVTSEAYTYYESVLDAVFQDIKEGRKRYIRDIKNAIDKNRSYTESKYDPDRDSYYSMKGTAQSVYTKCHYSLVSSCFEIDQFKDLFKEFDEYVGYMSRYPEIEELPTDGIPSIRTILINNPGKFKPRIIHIADNPIQDRCFYIHRRLKQILDDMDCDCTSNQEKGRLFLKNLTLDWFLEQDKQEKRGIYCFDFSNATDTLDQHFQHRVLEFIFGPEIANFWDIVSGLEKHIADVDGNYHSYRQTCGQPQGLGGSFDAFALAHHFIFLMDMKIAGLEDRSAKEFYRILGDDSVCSSVIPEFEDFNPGECQVDGMDIPRSELEMIHFGICENFAGFKVNYDKSESCHWNSAEAKLDFAKVTYRNGQLFTPVPFRLAMRFCKSEADRLAVAIWRMERSDPDASAFMDVILRDMSQDIVDLIKCGQIPFLEKFKDDRLYNQSWLARVRYATALSSLSSALAFVMINDKKRDSMGDQDILESAISKLFRGRKLRERMNNVHPDHKVSRVIWNNAEILELLSKLYETDDLDTTYLILACSSIGSDLLEGEFGEYLYELAQTADLLRKAKANPDVDVSTVFPDFDRRWNSQIMNLSNRTITRGIAKRPREEVSIFKDILQNLKSMEEALGFVPSVM